MVSQIDWGVPIEDFPTGTWDNFDAKVVSVQYQLGNYGWQIEAHLQPEQYEYESRGFEYDPDGLPPIIGWYSMGGQEDTWTVTEDGFEVKGDQINARAKAVRFVKNAMLHGNVKISGGNIQPLIGALCHWKNEQGGINPETGIRSTRVTPFPVSPPVGAKGSTLDDGSMEKAYDLIRTVMAQSSEDTMRIRNFATQAVEHEEEFGADIVKLASDPSTIESAVRAGILTKVDERTVSLS